MEYTFTDPETGERLRSSPLRDVAYFIPKLLDKTWEHLAAGLTAEDDALLAAAGGRREDVPAAFKALYAFCVLAGDVDVKSVGACAERAGLADLNRAAVTLVLARFARTMLGAVWVGLRSSQMEHECPILIQNLARRALEMTPAAADDRLRQLVAAAAPTRGGVTHVLNPALLDALLDTGPAAAEEPPCPPPA